MRDVGGIIEFALERHQSWYERMVKPGDGCNVYCLVYNENQRPLVRLVFIVMMKMKKVPCLILRYKLVIEGKDMLKPQWI